jgi:hypothetical protein
MSKLETNTIDNISGSSTLTIGDSNTSTIALKSGATLTNFPDNTSAFMAKLSADQTSVSDDTFTKVQFDSEEFDTDNAYDNSTNYRFTVPSGKAGKYFFTYSVDVDSEANSNLDSATTQLKVNNASEYAPEYFFAANPPRRIPVHSSALINLSVGDYVEVFCRIEATDASGGRFKTSASFFGGYKLIT